MAIYTIDDNSIITVRSQPSADGTAGARIHQSRDR
jgi:hypothetical protein